MHLPSPAAAPRDGRSPLRPHRRRERTPSPTACSGFTLLEVSLAMALLMGMVFVLLQITATNLRIARALQRTNVDATSLAAELSLTNQLVEGAESGDFGDLHPGYEWRRDITMVGTNGLFEVRFEVYNSRNRQPDSELVVLFFRPESVQRAGGGSSRIGLNRP